jgi:hypothetical protein
VDSGHGDAPASGSGGWAVGAGGSGGSWLPTGGVAGAGGLAWLDAGGFVDPGCEDLPPPEPYFECDLFLEPSGCQDGYGCYPYLLHPNDPSGCGQQSYGSVCIEPGIGSQGDLCGDGLRYCEPGYICVIGARPGARCAKLCSMDGAADCTDGLICGETDLPGIGVCY